MDTLILALAPAFAAGLAVQQLLELVGPFFDSMDARKKKKVFSAISLLLGFAFAAMGIRVLVHFIPQINMWLDVAVTALIVSAGTEGINSVLKYLGYSKEKEKAEVVMKVKDMADDESTMMRML